MTKPIWTFYTGRAGHEQEIHKDGKEVTIEDAVKALNILERQWQEMYDHATNLQVWGND